MPIDYEDSYYKNLTPPSALHERLRVWVYMVGIDGIPRAGVSRQPPLGQSPLYDTLYTGIRLALLALHNVEIAEHADEAARERLERLALTAKNQSSTAAEIGSTLLTLEEQLKGETVHIQLEKTASGTWIINKTDEGESLLDVVVAYVQRTIKRRKKG